MLRRELPKRFPGLQFFFQPADIVDQVLNLAMFHRVFARGGDVLQDQGPATR